MKNKMNEHRVRDYQSLKVKEDLYQYELGNELGAILYEHKEDHKQNYLKKQITKKRK